MSGNGHVEGRREILYAIHRPLCMAYKISPHPTAIPNPVRSK